MIWACSIQTEPRASASFVAQAFLPVFRVSPAIASLVTEEKHRHECLCYSGRASAHVLVAANAALWGSFASCAPIASALLGRDCSGRAGRFPTRLETGLQDAILPH